MQNKKEVRLVVNKSCKLNAMRQGYPTLREQRILATYLARINPLNPETRTVRFSLSEFSELCDIQDVKNISAYDAIAKKILQSIVTIPTENSGKDRFVLFSRCLIEKDTETEEWFFELSASHEGMQFFSI